MLQKISHTTMVLTLICMIILLSVNLSHGQESHLRLLNVPKFKLIARVVHGNGQQAAFKQVVTNEWYSNEQQRARIELLHHRSFASDTELLDKTSLEESTYFYDGSRIVQLQSTSITKHHSTADCNHSELKQLIEDLVGQTEKDSGVNYWLSPVFDKVPKHIVGLARFLAYVDVNYDKLIPIEEDEQLIRNQRCRQYRLEMPDWGPIKNFAISVSLPILADKNFNENDDNIGEKMRLPIRLRVTSRPDIFYFIEFSQIEPIFDEPIQEFDHGLDEFCFPLGCSVGLKYFKNVPQLPDDLITDLQQKVVSMNIEMSNFIPNSDQSETERKARLMGRYFVAYDGYQCASRCDSIQSAASDLEYSITIHDDATKRKYNIRQTVNDLYRLDSRDPMLRPSRLQQHYLGGKQCVVVESSTINYEPLIKFDELVDMGRAHVRGAETRVFELISDQYPPILFQHVSMRDFDTRARPYFEQPNQESTGTNSRKTFVFYFSSKDTSVPSSKQSASLGPLVRVDVLDNNGEPKFRLDIFDFIWQLSDAPNGDRQEELFSLMDYCSGDDSRVDRSASLTMQLIHDPGMQQSSVSLDEIRRLIGSPLARKKALARALFEAETKSITATKLHEIESRFQVMGSKDQANDKLLQLFVSAKVANIQELVYNPMIFSLGRLKSGILPSSIGSLAECFWQAAHARSQGTILFAYTNWSCFIDSKPILGEESTIDTNAASMSSGSNKGPKIIDSSIFDISNAKESDKSTLKVWQFEPKKDKKTNLKVSRWGIYSDIKRQVLRLPVIDVDTEPGSELPNYIHFKVAKVEVSNNDWPLDNSAEEDDILDGLGLVDGRPIVSHANDQVLDVGACQAACMSDFDCKSYSICVRGESVECIVSTKNSFRDKQLLDTIKTKSENAKQLRMRKIIKVELTQAANGPKTANGDNEDCNDEKAESVEKTSTTNIASKFSVELKVDRRCKIFNKRIRDMFVRQSKTMGLVRQKDLLHVDNEEQCAEFCLTKNLKYLKKVSILREQYLANYNRGEVENSARMLKKKFIEYQKYWCATFKFLNLASTTISKELLKFHHKEVYNGGICLLSRPKPIVDGQKPKTDKTDKDRQQNKAIDSIRAEMDMYEFVYKNLYKVQFGFRILNHNDITDGLETDVKTSKIFQQKVIETANIERCARICFLQTVDLKPSYCKSFDFVEVRRSSSHNSEPILSTYCMMNSLSLADIENNSDLAGLISPNVKPEMRVWHYEPRDEYMLMVAKVEDTLRSIEGANLDRSKIESDYAVAITVILAIAFGITMGIYVREPIRKRLFAIRATQPRCSVSQPLECSFDDAEHDDIVKEKSTS